MENNLIMKSLLLPIEEMSTDYYHVLNQVRSWVSELSTVTNSDYHFQKFASFGFFQKSLLCVSACLFDVCLHVQRTCGDQRTTWRSQFSASMCVSQRLNSAHQAWQRAPFPIKPSDQPHLFLSKLGDWRGGSTVNTCHIFEKNRVHLYSTYVTSQEVHKHLLFHLLGK